jgi:hypothetical protein
MAAQHAARHADQERQERTTTKDFMDGMGMPGCGCSRRADGWRLGLLLVSLPGRAQHDAVTLEARSLRCIRFRELTISPLPNPRPRQASHLPRWAKAWGGTPCSRGASKILG